jgi:Mg-chelatase subunit ChlD
VPIAFSQSVTAPVSTPHLTATAVEINKAGYLLKPAGLSTGEWPTLRLDFSVERADKTTFRNLAVADIQATLDGRPLTVKEGDLKLRNDETTGVLLLLDGSGSMSSAKVDKLRAAKEALKTLINNLGPTDQVSLVVFDEEPRTLVPATNDKETVKKAIDAFTIRKDKSRFTKLYDAVDFALREAQQQKIKNILLISDGWEDTPATRILLATPHQLGLYKLEREQRLTQASRRNDIRVFTVAIGDERGVGLSYVDRAALADISKGANGGGDVYIEVTAASLNEALQEKNLITQLQQTLNDLRQSFRYSYSLDLHLSESAQSDTREHKLWVGFTVGESPRVQLPVEYTYSSTSAGGPPVVKNVKLQPAVFIASAPRTAKWPQLLVIYLAMMSVLVVMAIVPAIGKRLLYGAQKVRLVKSIKVVDGKSPLVGEACPNEGTNSGRIYLFREGDVILVCPQCKTGHHLSCWRFNENHCMNRNCEFEMVVPAQTLAKYGLERELRPA